MNLAPPVYQFLYAVTGGAKDGQLDIHGPGIRTQDLWCSQGENRQARVRQIGETYGCYLRHLRLPVFAQRRVV